jgi:hypothetical protein
MYRGEGLHGHGVAMATPKEEENLNNWYNFICSYPINILFGYSKQFCCFKGRCYCTNIDNMFSLMSIMDKFKFLQLYKAELL